MQNGYTGTISTAFGSPIAGRQAWEGISGGSSASPTYITTIVNLPAAAMGQNIQLRFRRATDNSVSRRAGGLTPSRSRTGFDCCVAQGGPCAGLRPRDSLRHCRQAGLQPRPLTARTPTLGDFKRGTPAPPADTPPNAAFVNDPELHIRRTARLTSVRDCVYHCDSNVPPNRNLENGFDGGVLELSTNGGTRSRTSWLRAPPSARAATTARSASTSARR